MKGIAKLLSNHLLRAIAQRGLILTTLTLTLLSIFIAVYFTSTFEMKGRIAVVTKDKSLDIQHIPYHVDIVQEMPPTSKLVLKKYDAVLIDQEKGQFDIVTIKSDIFTSQLERAITHPERITQTDETERGIGTNILGFLMMFVLLEGLMFMTFFTEDKQIGTLRRIVTTPVGLSRYLATQCLFTFMMTYLPTFGILVIAQEWVHIDIGLTYPAYSMLLALLALLSTGFALFMTAVMENPDNILSFSAGIVVLTSLISGSFYSIQHKGMMEWLTNLLPQKQLLTLAQGLEQKGSLWSCTGELSYMLLLTGVLFFAGIVVCHYRFRQGRYS